MLPGSAPVATVGVSRRLVGLAAEASPDRYRIRPTVA
jgi:hypothetical protein